MDERGLLDGKVTSGALLRDTGRVPVNVPHACGRYGFAFAIAKISHVFFLNIFSSSFFEFVCFFILIFKRPQGFQD